MHLSENVIYDYIDGLLVGEDDEKYSQHISSCPTCFDKVEKIRNIESEFRSFSLNSDFIDEKKESVYNEIKPCQSQGKIADFFARKIKLSFGRLAITAFSFAMVMVGSVKIFSPKNGKVEVVIPSSNKNLSETNILQISERVLSTEEHIKALEDQGWEVTLKKK